MPAQRAITLEELSIHFHLPEKMVAKKLGICLTSLKKLCRQHGIHRWPYRKLKSIEKKVEKLESLLQAPSEDVNGVRSKIHSLNEEKKRLPFLGQPSCAYGGVRRVSMQSSPSSLFEAGVSSVSGSSPGSWCGSSAYSPYTHTSSMLPSPRDGSPSLSSVASGHSRLAQRLRAVGSVQGHRQRLAASLGVMLPCDDLSTGSCAESVSTDMSETSYSSGDDFAEQPEDEVDEGLMTGILPGPVMFDSPMATSEGFSSAFGFDIPALGCGEEVLHGLHGDEFGDDMFAEPLHPGHEDYLLASAF
jgi:hypothetical protein